MKSCLISLTLLEKNCIKNVKKVWSFFKTTHVINPQYLINGESNQKNVTSKKDTYFNSLYEVCQKISCIFNQYRVITISKNYSKIKKKLIIS